MSEPAQPPSDFTCTVPASLFSFTELFLHAARVCRIAATECRGLPRYVVAPLLKYYLSGGRVKSFSIA